MDLRETFKGFRYFWKGLVAAKREMWVSLQVLLVLTLALSVMLYAVEHAAQPDNYSNIWDSILWSFMSYLGNPGKFAPADPVTIAGRLLWIIISMLKIAIFAIPAGLVANGFREAMSKDKQQKKNEENAQNIIRSMHTHCSLLKGVRFWPRKWFRFTEIMVNLDISQNDIISAVRDCPNLRLRDLSTWLTTTGGIKPEMMAVEMCYANTSYGYTHLNEPEKKSSKKSNVTIVAPTATVEAGLGYFAYHLARIGGFNVVINEQLSSNADKEENRCIVSGIRNNQYDNKDSFPKLHQFVDDIKACVSSNDNWIIVMNAAATPKEEDKKHQKIRFRLSVDDDQKENTLRDCTGTAHHEILQAFYDDVCDTMRREHDIEPYLEFSKGKASTIRNYIRNRFDIHPNVVEIDIADDYRVFGTDVKAQWTSIYTMACLIHKHFDAENKGCTCMEWTKDDVKQYRLDLIPKHKDE